MSEPGSLDEEHPPARPVEHWSVDRLPTLESLRQQLGQVFPPGLDGRGWAVAERAARSLYVFLYALAVEGVTENRVRPAMVTTMSDPQSTRTSVEERRSWWEQARRPRSPGRTIPGRWYAENTREPIRDETFRVWKEYGALLEDAVPTTSSRPRYRLARDFAELFDPRLNAQELDERIGAWQARYLTAAARARMSPVQQQITTGLDAQVRFPDGSSRPFTLGPSTPLLKAAVETFAPNFMHDPVVLVVAESRRRLAYEDAAQRRRVRLTPDPRVMPDLLLADVGAPGDQLQLVLLECVATGGVMSAERVTGLRAWLAANSFEGARLVFGSVFRDRTDAVYRRFAGDLAWGTFVWFASEPQNLMVLLPSGTFVPRQTLDGLAQHR